MQRPISDSEVSSSQELEENRQDTASLEGRASLQAMDQRINEAIRIALQISTEINAQKEVLYQKLQNLPSACGAASEAEQEFERQRLLDTLNMQRQLASVNVDHLLLLLTLQEVHTAILRADPIYAPMQEERLLQQQLAEGGISPPDRVDPPTDADNNHQ